MNDYEWHGRIVKWEQDGMTHRGQVLICREQDAWVYDWQVDQEVLVDYRQLELVVFTAS